MCGRERRRAVAGVVSPPPVSSPLAAPMRSVGSAALRPAALRSRGCLVHKPPIAYDRDRMRTLALAMALAIGIACGSAGAFACDDDSMCTDAGVAGTCQPSGYCSFPDGQCPSHQRYGAHAGEGLAGTCVPVDAAGSTGTPSSTSAASTSGSIETGTSDTGSSTTAHVPVRETGSTTGVDDSGDGSTGGLPLDPDLVLWLTFDDPDAPFTDMSSYGRAIECTLAADGCPTEMGGVAEFDGIDDLLRVEHDPALETDGGLTVAVRARNDAATNQYIHTFVARPYGLDSDNSWELFSRDQDGDLIGDLVLEIADPGGQIAAVAAAPIGDATWAWYAATWSPERIAVYLDGVLVAEHVATGMLFDDSPVLVGGDLDAGTATNWFRGAIDDLRIYRRVLDEAEIAALP